MSEVKDAPEVSAEYTPELKFQVSEEPDVFMLPQDQLTQSQLFMMLPLTPAQRQELYEEMCGKRTPPEGIEWTKRAK